MSTAVQSHDPHPATEPSYLVSKRGLMSWLVTVDHKRLGLMYLASVMFFFLIAGILAIVLRTELFTPDQDFMSAQTYNQVFTLHGAIMVFLFIIPAIPAALGNFLMPLMLGAKDVAFPRLNLFSLYVYWTGALMAIGSIVFAGIDTGWTFYTPYSTTTGGAVTLMVLAAFVLGFSSIFTGINFIATTHKLRAPGMGWFLYFFLIPFWAMFPIIILGVKGALILLGVYLVAFPIAKLIVSRQPWYEKAAREMKTKGTTSIGGMVISSGSGRSGGGGFSSGGGGFSGGGGSSGGSGASGSW